MDVKKDVQNDTVKIEKKILILIYQKHLKMKNKNCITVLKRIVQNLLIQKGLHPIRTAALYGGGWFCFFMAAGFWI